MEEVVFPGRMKLEFVFLPELLEGLSWSQAYDSMHFQAALKSKVHSSQESCCCLAGHSVAMASVASSIMVGCANPTENFSAWPEC